MTELVNVIPNELTIYWDIDNDVTSPNPIPNSMLTDSCAARTLHIARGCILWNNVPMLTYHNGNDIYWTNIGAGSDNGDAPQCFGRLQATRFPRLFSGVVVENGERRTFQASYDLMYNLTFTPCTNASSMGAKAETQHLWLSLGSTSEAGGVVQFTRVEYPDADHVAYARCSNYEYVDPSTHSVSYSYRGFLSDGLDAYTGFAYVDMHLSSDYTTLSGSAWLHPDKFTSEAPNYMLTGTYQPDSLGTPIDSAALDSSNIAVRQGVPPCLHADQLASLEDIQPRIESLFALPAPIPENVDSDYSTALHNLMLYYISDEQLKYIGYERPSASAIPAQLIDFVNSRQDVKDLLTGDYFYAFFSYMLANSDAGAYSECITSIDHYQERLDAYYNGSLVTSLSQNPTFRALSDRVYEVLYFQTIPEINPYRENAALWAKKLHDFMLQDDNAEYLLGDLQRSTGPKLHHLVVVLNSLDNSRQIPLDCPQTPPPADTSSNGTALTGETTTVDYRLTLGTDVYYRLLNRKTSRYAMSVSARDLTITADERMQVYELSCRQRIDWLYQQDVDTLPDSWKSLRIEIDELIANHSIDSPGSYWQYIVSNVLAGFETVLANNEALPCLDTLNKWLHTNCPKLYSIGLGTLAFTVGQTMMLVNAISTLTDWSSLTDAQRASAISSLSYTAIDAVSYGLQVTQTFIPAKVTATASNSAASSIKSTVLLRDGQISMLSGKGKNFFRRLAESTTGMKPGMALGLKTCGALMSMFAFATSVCDVVSDKATYGFSNAVFAFDVITAVVNGVAVAFALLDAGCFLSVGFATSLGAFAAMVPGIGWALVIAGIVLAFITSILRKYTKTAEQRYIEEHCVPFVTSLGIPSTNAVRVIVFIQMQLQGSVRNMREAAQQLLSGASQAITQTVHELTPAPIAPSSRLQTTM